MPAIKYRVMLTEDEKAGLEALLRKGKSAARKQARARVLLKAAEGWRDEETARALGVSTAMVARTRQRCVEEGVEAALRDRPRPGHKPKLTERQAAHIIAIACSDAPAGHDHWTLRLLAGRVVELEYAESCSHEAIRQLLKKHPQALAARGVVHPQGRRGVRGGDGGCAGPL
jgi:transposase